MQKAVWLLVGMVVSMGALPVSAENKDVVVKIDRGGAYNLSRRVRGIYVSRFRKVHPNDVVINWQKDVLGPVGRTPAGEKKEERTYILLAYKQRETELDVQTKQKYALVDPQADHEYAFSGNGCYQIRAVFGTHDELTYSAEKAGWVKAALDAVW